MSNTKCDICDENQVCLDGKCQTCFTEKAVLQAITKLQKKRKIRVGELKFSLNDNEGIVSQPLRKRTKLNDACDAMRGFVALCDNLSDPSIVREFHFGLRVSLTIPVDESIDDESSEHS